MRFCLFIFVPLLLCAVEENTTLPIHISGDTFFSQEILFDALDVKQKNPLLFWKEEQPSLDIKLLPTLPQTLKSFYDSEGFYDANFTIKENNSSIDIDIKAGKPIIVKELNITEDANVSSIISFKKGDRFRAKAFIQIKQNIIEALLDKGYCSYDFDTKAFIDLEKHTAALRYLLKKGGICTFGDANVEGLESIEKEIILSRVRAKKGERFDPKKVEQTYTDIYRLNSFDSVLVSVDRKFYNVVPVDIEVHEVENAYHFEGGVGYDTYIGPRIHASLIKKNFYGNAQQSGIRLSWSKREQLAIGKYYKPALFIWWDYGIDFGSEFGYSNLEFRGFKEKKGFGKFYLEHNEGRLNLRGGLALENIDITSHEDLNKNETPLQAVSAGNFLLLYPYLNIVYDARDDKLNPKYGYYLSSSVEYGLDYKSDATSYIKSLFEARVMHTFNDLTLASVVKIGVVDEKVNRLPESKRFFAGGSFANRAYGFNSIGVITSKTTDTIFGGYTWENLSFEANYPLIGKVYGALFNDNTMLNDTSYDFTGNIISSAGIGIRYLTPIGPFKVDVGVNVNKPSQYGISFQIGQSF